MSFLTGVALVLLIIVEATSLPTIVKTNICDGACEACLRRYGCMTPQWGQCCTQFYQYNGKRSQFDQYIGKWAQHSITDSESMQHIEIYNVSLHKRISNILDKLRRTNKIGNY